MRFFSLLVFAFVLRVIGLHYGLPHLYHQDEPIIVNHALGLGLGGWNPHFFVIPPFTIYGMFILSGFAYLAGHGLGIFSDKMDFAIQFLQDPTLIYLIGRFCLSVIPGVMTVYVLARMGSSLGGRRIGFLSALFLSISHIHVLQSHFIYVDIPLTLVATIFFFLICRLIQHHRLKDYILVGIVLGWGVSIKYTMVYFAPALIAVHFLTFGRQALTGQGLRMGVITGSVALATFAAIAPFTFLDAKEALSQIAHQAGAQRFVGAEHHLIYSIAQGVGWGIVVMALVGWWILWKTQKKTAVVFTVYVVVFYIANTFWGQAYSRYMLPLIPVICWASAIGWVEVKRVLLNGPGMSKVAFLIIFMMALRPTLYTDRLLLHKDTRTQCLEWVNENIPEGAVIVVDNRFQAPHLMQTKRQLAAKFQLLDDEEVNYPRKKKLEMIIQAHQETKTYTRYSLHDETANEIKVYMNYAPWVAADWSMLREIGAEYLIVNYTEKVALFHHLLKTASPPLTLVATFNPYKELGKSQSDDRYDATSVPHSLKELYTRRRLGPYLEVYKI